MLKFDLANLKLDFDKLDIDKLKTVPVDLCKLSNVVNNDIVKRDVYNTDKKYFKYKDWRSGK